MSDHYYGSGKNRGISVGDNDIRDDVIDYVWLKGGYKATLYDGHYSGAKITFENNSNEVRLCDLHEYGWNDRPNTIRVYAL